MRSRAAERRGVAKSVVSERLAELERQFGVPLVSRTTRSSSLTDGGRVLLDGAVALLGDLDKLVTEISEVHGRLSGRLRVTAPWSFGMQVLKPVVCRFVEEHPEVELERIPVIRYSRGDALGPIILCGPDDTSAATSPPVRLTTSSGEMLIAAAEAGLGFAIAPDFLAAEGLATGALERVFGDYRWSEIALYVVYPPTRRPTVRARAFVETAEKAVGRDAVD